jgi:alpha-mannosidase
LPSDDDRPDVLHLVSHTHWDREWYQSRERFRLRLVDLLDHLLIILDQDPAFRHFHLDSQTIVLEDYLEVRPEREDDLRRHIRAGRIEVGPWYVLNDTYLTSAEATVRNLLLGTRQAQGFGRVGRIGYLPDQFGNISQLPQIFRGFGVADAVVGRGISAADVPVEFVWEAPDGSRVLCSFLVGWYNNAQRLDPDPERAADQLRAAAQHVRRHGRSHQVLLMNGVDHLEAQENLSPILAAVGPKLAPDVVRHSTVSEYFAAVREELGGEDRPGAPVWRGEMRQQTHRHNVLNGTLSSRMSLKLANHACQLDLERWAEPWSAIAGLLGEERHRAQLWTAWRALLQNHPHDSICGCSIDPVHQDMVPRFRHAAEIAAELTRRAHVWIGQHIAAALPDGSGADGPTRVALAVFNAAAHPLDGVLTATLDFAPEARGGRLRLRDVATGAEVPCRVLWQGPAQRLVTGPVSLPRPVAVARMQVRFLARDVPALGYRTFIAERVGGFPYVYGDERLPDDAGLTAWVGERLGGRNAHLALTIAADGTFTLRTEGEGATQTFPGLGLLVDDGEAGDAYLHEPPARDATITGFAGRPEIALAEHGPDWLTWSVRGALAIPSALTADRQARQSDLLELPVELRLTLVRDRPWLELEARVQNTARDHRLRLVFPTGFPFTTSEAAIPFDVVSRPVVLPAAWEAQGNHPAQAFVDVHAADGGRGLALLLDGSPEYHVLGEPGGTAGQALAVTLLRCTDVVGDNPGFDRAPDGQCPGPLTVRLGILPHRGDWRAADLYRAADAFQLPLRALQLGLDPEVRRFRASAGPGPNPFVPPDPPPHLPPAHSFVTVDVPGAVLSALKPAEDGVGLVLRLFNPSAEPLRGRVALDRPLAGAALVTLAEQPERELGAGTEVAVALGPKRIASLRLVPG